MLIDDIDALGLAEKMDPSSDTAIGHVGRARGHALNVGIMALMTATAESESERAASSNELLRVRDLYVASVREASRLGQATNADEIAAERAIIYRFAERIERLEPETRMDRATAAELARTSREEVVPAIYTIVSAFQQSEMEELQADIARLSEKASMVDRLVSEMERITRMIGLVAINASIEAARAGDASGRSFRVIAEEVRNQASQCTNLLEEMRANLISRTRRDAPARNRHAGGSD